MTREDHQLVTDELVRAKFARFPVISLSAEYLVMGHLLRRNVLTYKAPPGNEGYDLIWRKKGPGSIMNARIA